MKATSETVTVAQIRAVYDESIEARDYVMAAICNRAGDFGANWADLLSESDLTRVLLMTEEEARAEVARVLGTHKDGCCCDACNPEYHPQACSCCGGEAKRDERPLASMTPAELRELGAAAREAFPALFRGAR